MEFAKAILRATQAYGSGFAVLDEEALMVQGNLDFEDAKKLAIKVTGKLNERYVVIWIGD
jgi:hypothetical protein